VAHTDDPDALVDTWIASHPAAERTLETLADIHVGRVFDLTTLPVAVREIRNLLSSPAVRPGT
jgi:glutamate dehydrogenase